MEFIKPRLYSGLRDRLPEQMNYRGFVVSKLQTLFERYGFEPLETPAMEFYDILTGKYGEEAENLIYRLDYKDGKTLALRYDLTVPLSRVIAMNAELVRPIFKRYQIQQVWRGERPQRGRYREFTQCDIDAIGSTSMLQDAEIIAAIYEMMIGFGFHQFEILINNRKILDGMVKYAEVGDRLKEVCRSIDKLEKIGAEKVRQELAKSDISARAIKKIFSVIEIEGHHETVLDELEKIIGDVAQEGIGELREVRSYLSDLGINEGYYRFDPALARGLDYYTGPVFEVVIKDAGIGSVVGGGRWDTLIGQYTGKHVPAVGTSFGLERLIDSMEKLHLLPQIMTKTQVLVVPFNTELIPQSLRFLAELRSAGINSEIYGEPKSFRQTFGYASRKGIPLALVVAPDELSNGQLAIRNMETREQVVCSVDRFVDRIQAILPEL